MSWVAAAVGAVGIFSSLDTGRRQANTASDAQRMTEHQDQQTRADLQPWMKSGRMGLNALDKYAGLSASGFNPNAPGMKPFGMEDFNESPSYQFNLQQGQQAIDKAANARGNYYAPQTLQDISKFSQGMAGNEFNNAYAMYNQDQGNVWNRLFGISGTGQNAAAQMGGFGAAAAQNAGNYGIQRGDAMSAGLTGATGNALYGGAGAYNNYLQNQILKQQQPTYGGGVDYSNRM